MRQKAFTLIELLIVVAIISILASVVIVNLSNGRTKARDAKRMSDLDGLSKAAELYYDANNSYPRDGGWCTQVSNTTNGWSTNFQSDMESYLSIVPKDPRWPDSSKDYFYSNSDDQHYRFLSELETDNNNSYNTRLTSGGGQCATINNEINAYDYKVGNY